MNKFPLILLAICSAATWCPAAIKPPEPRKGLSPKEAPQPANPAPAPAPTAPPAAPAKADPHTPSPTLLKDLAALESIHAVPANARDAITRCGNLRNPLATYPAHLQKLNYFWAVSLANSGDLGAASEKFSIASAPTAPDQTIAVRALNSQISFYLRDPELVDRAVALVKTAIARSAENSPEQLNARFQGACALYILDEPVQATTALKPVDAALRGKSGDPEAEALKQNTANLLSAISEEEAAKNPENPPHVFYAPWRGPEIRFGLGVTRRIADLAFNLRDFPRASVLYQALEKEAATRTQPEIQAWSRMQRGRLLAITGEKEEAEKLLSSFLNTTPYKDANCTPFALLRLGLLYHNYLKDIPRAEKTFDLTSTRFKNTPEARICEYYRAMIPFLAGNPRAAHPLFVSFVKSHPKDSLSDYLTGHLIPGIEKQLTALAPTR